MRSSGHHYCTCALDDTFVLMKLSLNEDLRDLLCLLAACTLYVLSTKEGKAKKLPITTKTNLDVGAVICLSIWSFVHNYVMRIT